jgi:hypothetical protein
MDATKRESDKNTFWEQVARMNESDKTRQRVDLIEEEPQKLIDRSKESINNYPTPVDDAFYTTIENGVTGYHRKRRI